MGVLIEELRKGNIPEYFPGTAEKERMPLDVFVQRVIEGSIVVPRNRLGHVAGARVCAVGRGLRTKVNANIGTSPDQVNTDNELLKLRAAIDAGTDAVMDLSTGGNIRSVLSVLRRECPLPLGTVPVYQAVCETIQTGKKAIEIDLDHLFVVIEQQAAAGVDFITVHCGINRESVQKLSVSGRIAGVVSRGGSFIVELMRSRGIENPLYAQFDRLLDIARTHDLTLSLGDGLRPGALADASDSAQLAELNILGELVKRARGASVQVIVEGPGHVPIDQIQANMQIQKTICSDAPFYVLGPLVTDVAAGYDHITSAIGGALAAAAGADFLCYVTPSEHIHLPEPEDVHVGVIAARIAAHAGDIAKKVPGAREWDDAMSKARKALDWERQQELALDGKNFHRARQSHQPADGRVCTMCGSFCAIKEEVSVV